MLTQLLPIFFFTFNIFEILYPTTTSKIFHVGHGIDIQLPIQSVKDRYTSTGGPQLAWSSQTHGFGNVLLGKICAGIECL